MRKLICFDMDGTIANLYEVPNWLEKLRNEDPSPYLEAKPLYDMEALREVLIQLSEKGWEIRVISWLSKNSTQSYKEAVRKAKLAWLKKYNFPMKKAHLIAYGTTKANCIRKIADAAILIDDNAKVRDGWSMGETVNPIDGNLIEKLKTLL